MNAKASTGVISADELYTLTEFRRRLSIPTRAWREMKKRGFKPIPDGKRVFVSGRMAIEYFEKQATNGD